MTLKLRDFRSRLGRKFLILLFSVVFIPMLLLAFLGHRYVDAYLHQQNQEELHNEARFFSIALYQRMQRLGTEFEEAVRLGGWTTRQPFVSDIIRWSSVQFESGLNLFNSDGQLLKDRLKNGKLVLLSQRDGSILLALQQQPAGQQAVIYAAKIDMVELIKSEYLPGQVFNYCVFGGHSEQIYCNRKGLISSQAFAAEKASNSLRPNFSMLWKNKPHDHLAQVQSVYISNQFGSPNWHVWVSKPVRYIKRALRGLSHIFIAVTLVTLLSTLLVGGWQIRRILQPLGQFNAATREISAGHYDATLKVEGTDEFTDLAQAFNQMADRIGKQFKLLTGFSTIDQLILSAPDMEQIASSAVQTLHNLVTCDQATVVLRDQDDSALLWLFDAKNSGATDTFEVRQLTLDEEGWLASMDSIQQVRAEDRPFLNWLWQSPEQGGIEGGYIFPIAANNKNRGLIALGWQGDVQLPLQDRRLMRDFADRLAVAITAARREQKLYLQTHFDALTDLPNRLLVKDRLLQALKHARRNEGSGAVLFVDLDNFKSINETEGRALGDEILVRTAERLQACVSGEDTVARQGGDEFIVVVNDIDTPMKATRIATQIITMLATPFKIEGKRYFLTCSIGIAVFPNDGDDVETLLHKADISLNKVKAEGGGHHRYYEDKMNQTSQRRALAEHRIREALLESKMELHFQPQWYLASDHFNVEALVRLQDHEWGLMTPGEFIDVAEDTGLIIGVGEWVLSQACRQLASWRAQQVPVRTMSVNVSGLQLARTDIVATVENAITSNGLQYSDLELEVTETFLVHDAEGIISKLRQLCELGVSVAIDDFGTGYSALSYLHSLPFDLVKIDKSFVTGLEKQGNRAEIIRAIIGLAKSLNKVVMAEGVENSHQLSLLRDMGCDAIQGFLISKPLTAANVGQFLAGFSPPDTDQS